MTEQLTELIMSRAHWRVVVRPTKFAERRIESYSDLERLVERTSVMLRGWDFPHIDPRAPIVRGNDHIGQSVDWQHIMEQWTLYQSAQLHFLGCLWEDWRDRSAFYPADPDWAPNVRLPIGDVVARFTEIFEFASRLAQNVPGEDDILVRAVLHGLRSRRLWNDDRGRVPFLTVRQADIDEFPYEQRLPRAVVIGAAFDLARRAARELFARFGWEVDDRALRSFQDGLRPHTRGAG